MLKRLFIILPAYIVYFLSVITCVMPLVYWVFTGKSYNDLMYDEDENNLSDMIWAANVFLLFSIVVLLVMEHVFDLFKIWG